MVKLLSDPEGIPLYHGTSDLHARRIISRGVSNHLERIGALEFARQLYTLLLARVSEWTELAKLFAQHGSQFWKTAPIGLKNISDGNQQSLITYGSFYVTLNPQIAVSYAARGKAGSELLTIIRDGLMVLRACGETCVDSLLDQNPELRAHLEYSHRPVVLELSGLSLASLETEDGHAVADTSFIDFCREMTAKGIRCPAAFRVRRASADKVVGVYSMPDPIPRSLWNPDNPTAQFDRAVFQSVKLEPRDWIRSYKSSVTGC